MEDKQTGRGFELTTFTDHYGSECRIQESSLSIEGGAIWLGVSKLKGQIMASDAIGLGIDTKGQTTGWVDYNIPTGVVFNESMHLTRKNVEDLIPYLQRFVETGYIHEDEEPEKELSLKDQYYEHILDDVDFGEVKNKVFKILSDMTGRRGLGQEWGQIDDDIQEEIIEKWIDIVENK